MILGQSAATTAALAIDEDIAVQDVSYDKLRERLIKDGQVLQYTRTEIGKNNIDVKALAGIVIDDQAADLSDNWTASTSGASVGREYFHDRNAGDGHATASFVAKLKAGRYEVRLSYSHHPNRATNVPVTIEHAGGTKAIAVDQRQVPPIQKLFISLGTYSFRQEKPAVVRLSNEQTNGYVIADAVQFVPVE